MHHCTTTKQRFQQHHSSLYYSSLERSTASGMAFADTAARKLLHGGAIAQGVADGGGISFFGLDGLWRLVTGFFAAPAGAGHELVLRLDALRRWLQPAAVAAAPPFLPGVAAVLLLVTVVWFSVLTIAPVIVGACEALVYAFCYLGRGLYCVAMAVARALVYAFCYLGRGLCTAWPWRSPGRSHGSYLPAHSDAPSSPWRPPGAASMLISRPAFEAAPALYFQVQRAAGPVVAAAVFCTRAVAAPVAALFLVPVD